MADTLDSNQVVGAWATVNTEPVVFVLAEIFAWEIILVLLT